MDAREAMFVGRTSDGLVVRRPLSPHLQVYRPQITSALSILNRFSGIVLAVGTVLLAWWLIAAATSDAAYATVSAVIRSPIGLLAMFGWTVALWFHFFAGLRHLAWDSGAGYELPKVHASGWAVVIATLVCTAVCWVLWLVVG
jgi:succinate dehydrogenase / fumarate reductase cytochrome b subunit